MSAQLQPPARPEAPAGIVPASLDQQIMAAEIAIQREGVQIHFARIRTMAGQFAEARSHLNLVTDPTYADLKARLIRNITERESGTNHVDQPVISTETTNSIPTSPKAESATVEKKE